MALLGDLDLSQNRLTQLQEGLADGWQSMFSFNMTNNNLKGSIPPGKTVAWPCMAPALAFSFQLHIVTGALA